MWFWNHLFAGYFGWKRQPPCAYNIVIWIYWFLRGDEVHYAIVSMNLIIIIIIIIIIIYSAKISTNSTKTRYNITVLKKYNSIRNNKCKLLTPRRNVNQWLNETEHWQSSKTIIKADRTKPILRWPGLIKMNLTTVTRKPINPKNTYVCRLWFVGYLQLVYIDSPQTFGEKPTRPWELVAQNIYWTIILCSRPELKWLKAVDTIGNYSK